MWSYPKSPTLLSVRALGPWLLLEIPYTSDYVATWVRATRRVLPNVWSDHSGKAYLLLGTDQIPESIVRGSNMSIS